MSYIKIPAYAKINLSLDVLSKRPDGYHELCMIMQTISLHDIVSIKAADYGTIVECDHPEIPAGSGNIATRAAELIKAEYGIGGGIHIRVEKNIPVAAGLAGGSTDAAAVIKGMDRLFGLGLDIETMKSLGKRLGADVPYCITGGTMLAEGIGERLSPLRRLKDVNIVLLKPNTGVPTAWVYKNLDFSKINDRPDTSLLINALDKNDIYKLSLNMRNVLETVTIPAHNVVSEAKERLLYFGALGSLMSGSGPSVFGIFSCRSDAERAYEKLKDDGRWQAFLTETL